MSDASAHTCNRVDATLSFLQKTTKWLAREETFDELDSNSQRTVRWMSFWEGVGNWGSLGAYGTLKKGLASHVLTPTERGKILTLAGIQMVPAALAWLTLVPGAAASSLGAFKHSRASDEKIKKRVQRAFLRWVVHESYGLLIHGTDGQEGFWASNVVEGMDQDVGVVRPPIWARKEEFIPKVQGLIEQFRAWSESRGGVLQEKSLRKWVALKEILEGDDPGIPIHLGPRGCLSLYERNNHGEPRFKELSGTILGKEMDLLQSVHQFPVEES